MQGNTERKSGKSLDRPELARLRSDAREGRIAKLYLYRLDRLTRRGIRDAFEVVEELGRHGVEVVTVADGFDLQGPAAEVVLAVMAWASKMERLAINERIASAREHIEAEGRRWGRPPHLDAGGRARVFALAGSGMSVREVAQAVGAPRSTVHGALPQRPPEHQAGEQDPGALQVGCY